MTDYIDLHCDTVLTLLDDERAGRPSSILENEHHIDERKLKEGGALVQTFALFTDQKKGPVPEKEALELYDRYVRMLEESPVLAPAYTLADIVKNKEAGKISALLSLEEGGVVFDDLAMLRNWYRLGVRMIALTWNYPNAIAHPNLSMAAFSNSHIPDPLQRVDHEHGLSEFGREYVREMNRLGMIVDVSHASDKTFWDVAELVPGPFISSHSNARAVCNVARNLDDDMIAELARHGGVMGLNFCADFLNDEGKNETRLKDIVAHIDHIKKVGGVDVIALGSDFDGIDSNLEIKDASGMQQLADALRQHHYTEDEIDRIFHKNALRVFAQVLK